MEKEEIMYVELPDGAEYERVEVTENGIIGIVYVRKFLTSLIPKPEPLIGGTEVYQKDNDTPYWYCKIKDGRDEFMHVYFGDLTESDLFYDSNGNKREFVTKEQEKFKADIMKALKNKPKEGYRWIPVYEPSINLNDNLCYSTGKRRKVLLEVNYFDWEKKFKEYSPDNGSQQASSTTYFLLLLRWLKDRVATLEQLADDSKEIGHFWDSENAKHYFEKTGEREFGGLYGFVGNTYKIVKDSESSSGFSLLGGCCSLFGRSSPLAHVVHVIYTYGTNAVGVGLLELTK